MGTAVRAVEHAEAEQVGRVPAAAQPTSRGRETRADVGEVKARLATSRSNTEQDRPGIWGTVEGLHGGLKEDGEWGLAAREVLRL